MIKDITARLREPGLFFRLSGMMALYTFPVLGILGALTLLALKQYQYLILSIYLIVPIICAPLAYMLTRGSLAKDFLADDTALKFLVAGYLSLYAFSITLLYLSDVRPVLYFCAIAAMATLILVQIVRLQISRARASVILLQIMALALNICWGITLKYYEYVGRTDVLVHTFYVNSLAELGHVTTVFYDYQPFPLWHIMNAGIYLAGGAGFPASKVMAIAGGLVFAVLPVVIYLTGVKLFKEHRIALIAALVTILFPDLVAIAASSIPRMVAEILMVYLLYLLLAGKSRTRFLLIVPIMAAIVIYHSVSILFIAVILLVLYVMQMLFVKKEEHFVSIWYVVLAVAMTATYWVLNADMLIQRLVHNATAPTGRIVTPKALIQNVPWNELFNYLQYVPAILFILAGIFLLLLSGRVGSQAKIFALAALLLTWVSFPGPLLMIGRLVSGFGIDRIAEYTFLILILAAAAGIVVLFYRSGRTGKAILITIFTIWALLAVSNDWVASDNPLVKRPFYTYYFTEQEVAGMERLVTHATEVLESDYVVNRYYEASPYSNKTTILQVDMPNMTFLRHSPGDVLLIRDGEQGKRELRGAITNIPQFHISPDADNYTYIGRNLSVWNTLTGYCCVYDSSEIRAYTG